MEKNVKKLFVIGSLTFLFWIVSLFIRLIVDERSDLSEVTQTEISKSWSGSQEFIGPILCVPVYTDSSVQPFTCMYILPEALDVEAKVESETLHRGIFDTPVYRTHISATGTFDLRQMKAEQREGVNRKTMRYDWQHVQVITAISDKRGIEEAFQFTLGTQQMALSQHFSNYENPKLSSIFRDCAVCQIADLSAQIGQELPFTLAADLKGSQSLDFAPVGNNSRIRLSGNSSDPSFNGMLLPSTREVTDQGFVAEWKVNSMNRSDQPQVFHSDGGYEEFQTVGARLMVVGGQYTQTDRALKYAILVILLTLTAVYVAEMCVNSEISVLNYLLIGAAVVLFYLLLLSLCEWIGFSWAYLASCLVVIVMITAYLHGIMHQPRAALAVCLFMALIDLFIYVLLGIAEMALLVGTIGLFVLLGAAMYFSLRIRANRQA